MSDGIVRHVIVRGLVQGVGYRAFVEHEAHRRALHGWVRNRRDGSVEAVFAGPRDKVEAMIEVCRRGPYAARVDALNHRDGGEADLGARAPGDAFTVLPTA
jgi:acylphosphatase